MTDFWWLTPEQANKYVYVELAHHQPLSDEDDAPLQAFSSPCFAGIQSVSTWQNKYQNTNVYRSLKIWSDNSKKETLSGPFVIDIDNDEDLDDALTVTRNAVKCIISLYNLRESDIRLFFTGHKGFNIEVLLSAIGLDTPNGQDNVSDFVRNKIICELRQDAGLVSQPGRSRNLVSEKGTVIDLKHDYVRLHNSINKWVDGAGQIARKKIGLTLSELNGLSLPQIVDRSIARG